MKKNVFLILVIFMMAPIVQAAVVYNPLSLSVTEIDHGIAVEGMGLTDDHLQLAYNAGQATVDNARWANAPDTGAVLTVDGQNTDYVFEASFNGVRTPIEMRLYTEHQTNDKRFYDFDLFYSTTSSPSTFTQFLTLTQLTDIVKGVEIIIDNFQDQIQVCQPIPPKIK